MKSFILITIIIASLPLDASQAKTVNPYSPVAYARLARQEPASDDETSPTQYSPSEVELRDLSPAKTRPPLTAPANIKTATEKNSTAAAAPLYPTLSLKLSTPTALKDVSRTAQSAEVKQAKEQQSVTLCATAVKQILKSTNLKGLMYKKITQQYPKIPLQILPITLPRELRYQRNQLESKNRGQEIILSIETQFDIEAYCACVPFLNASTKELIKAKLKDQNPALPEDQIEAALPEIVKLAIHQKMHEINRKFFRNPRPEDRAQEDYAAFLDAYTKISALTDPRDRQLLDETVDIVLEEPAPTPYNKNSSGTDCIIS